MSRVIEYIGEQTEISDYLPEHYPKNQTCKVVDGIFINPLLRPDFDSTPNDLREEKEVNDWYGVPYIISTEFYEETFQDYLDLMKRFSYDSEIKPEGEFKQRQMELKKQWLERWPRGRYEVRCLTYGAWDRSSSIGMFNSLEKAVECCHSPITLY